MPLTITKLKMWKDPGYTRECVEVPPAGSWKMPAADYVSSENLRPRKGSTLTAVELPLPYLQVMDMSYLYIEVEDGVTPTPNTVKLFGWIVSIEETASSNEAVRITWTVDYWRTYAQDAVFGAGTITRCGDGTYKRPYQTQPRKWVVGDTVDNPFNPDPMVMNSYGFLLITSEVTATSTQQIEFPPGSGHYITVETGDQTGFAYYWGELDDGTALRESFTAEEIYSGRIDELIHGPNNEPILPSSIIGCWIIPTVFLNRRDGLLWKGPFEDSQIITTVISPDRSVSYHRSTTLSKDYTVKLNYQVTDTPQGFESDDNKRCVAVDPFGEVTSEMPWGYGFSSGYVDMSIDISVNGVTIYYCDHAVGLERAMEEGCYLVFPGLPVPINSNAWSEYAYTYQRSYDKRNAEIQRNQRAVSGFAGIGSSAIQGAVTGAIGGKSVFGAVAGTVAGVASPFIDYFASGHFNDELQEETDKLVSNQTSNVLIGGGSPSWKHIVGGWKIVQLEADSVSAAEYDQHVANDGYTVDIPVTDATTFITAGGALQIQNLMLTGDIPPAGKSYIKNILSNGVRIVENNPTGVVP